MSGQATLVVGTLPRITPARFRAVLEQAGSPAAREADACWQAVAQEGVDPLFALAIFHHESRFGTVGIVAQYDLKNPGATRTSRTGVGSAVAIPNRGQFWRYPSWTEGFRDLARRLVDPTFVYRQRGAETVEAIIPLWAPVTDGNNPASYIAAVRAFMAQHAQEPLPGVPLRVDFVPRGRANRPGIPMQPRWVTIHETANEAPSANAEMHRRFVHAGGGAEGVSFHFVVDDREVIQLLPTVEVAWHAGDGLNGPGNRTSIAIELCVNAGSDWSRTQEHGAVLTAALCRAFGLGAERVVPHQRWSGKQCPRRLLASGFDRFRARVEAVMTAGKAQSARYFPETGHWVAHGFLRYWEQFGGLPIFGYPLTGELTEVCEDGQSRTVQYFERAVFEWHPDKPELADRYYVLLRRLGAAAARAAGYHGPGID